MDSLVHQSAQTLTTYLLRGPPGQHWRPTEEFRPLSLTPEAVTHSPTSGWGSPLWHLVWNPRSFFGSPACLASFTDWLVFPGAFLSESLAYESSLLSAFEKLNLSWLSQTRQKINEQTNVKTMLLKLTWMLARSHASEGQGKEPSRHEELLQRPMCWLRNRRRLPRLQSGGEGPRAWGGRRGGCSGCSLQATNGGSLHFI